MKTKYLESDLQHLLDLAKTLLIVFHVEKGGREKLFPFLCFNKKNRGKISLVTTLLFNKRKINLQEMFFTVF